MKAAILDRGATFDPCIADLLFAAGADPNLGLTPPLHLAVARGDRELVAYLIDRGADPTTTNGVNQTLEEFIGADRFRSLRRLA